jgi:hypothetical protein
MGSWGTFKFSFVILISQSVSKGRIIPGLNFMNKICEIIINVKHISEHLLKPFGWFKYSK